MTTCKATDANGNMVSGDNRTVSYSAFDLPVSITKGTITTSFAYGPDRARYKRADVMPDGLTTTIYAGGGSYERITRPDASLEQKTYIGGFAIVTERVAAGNTTLSTRYLSTDHLGSIDAITDEAGLLTQKMSFDAWGKRRQANWTNLASPLYFDTSVTTRGFTGHEEVDPVGLIHMNGRVYDPELGRFLSADPFVQDASNAQSWNRYSYVLNNPLSMTDPTGFFFGSIFSAIGNFVGKVFSAIASVFKAALKIPLVRAVIQIAACGSGVIAVCIGVTGALALAAGGGIEDALMAMAFTAASMGVWSGTGAMLSAIQDTMQLGVVAFAAMKGAVHGVVGGALSLAQGGSFIDGFAANAVGAVVGVFSNTISQGNVIADSMIVGAVGGTASVLTGGKFANGAITAAFANMWNKCVQQNCSFGEKANAWVNGGASIFYGVGNAYRFIGRAVGLYGEPEAVQWDQEGEVMDQIIQRYAEDPKFRQWVNTQGAIQSDAVRLPIFVT